MSLTADRVREVLDYDPETGVFRWRVVSSNRIRVGAIAGAKHGRGYTQISIDGQIYLAHRLAWLYVHGVWPSINIDHANGVKTDNRLANLRECDQHQNNGNYTRLSVRNTSGYRGVSWVPRTKKWAAAITTRNNKRIHIGTFPTAEAAHEAYVEVARRHFGEFFNEGAARGG